MKTERGLALQDLIAGAFDYIDTIELKPHARIYLLDHLATTECVTISQFRSAGACVFLFSSLILVHDTMRRRRLRAPFKESVS